MPRKRTGVVRVCDGPSCVEEVYVPPDRPDKRFHSRACYSAAKVEASRELLLVRTQKRCCRCLVDKPLDAFHMDNARWDRKYPECKACLKRWNTPRRALRSRLRNRKLSEAAFRAMWRKQRGRCAVCKLKPLRLNIDHCHVTGKVRGLLCSPCNKGLGHFRDNVEYLAGAITYLEENQTPPT